MTRGRKTGGRDFVKGDPRAGRKPLPEDYHLLRKLNKGEFERLVNQWLWQPYELLEAASEDPKITGMERMVIAIICRGIKTGEWGHAEWIAQRLIGKVTDKVEVSQPKPYVIKKANGEVLELGAKLESDEDSSA